MLLTKMVHPAVVKGQARLKSLKEGTLREALLELREQLVNPTFQGCTNARVWRHHQSGKFSPKARRSMRRYGG